MDSGTFCLCGNSHIEVRSQTREIIVKGVRGSYERDISFCVECGEEWLTVEQAKAADKKRAELKRELKRESEVERLLKNIAQLAGRRSLRRADNIETITVPHNFSVLGPGEFHKPQIELRFVFRDNVPAESYKTYPLLRGLAVCSRRPQEYKIYSKRYDERKATARYESQKLRCKA